MQIAFEQMQLASAHHSRVEMRLLAEGRTASVGFAIPPASDPEATISASDLGASDTVNRFTSQEEFNWRDEAVQRRFGLLERKVGRQAATKEEENTYFLMRASRRAWIRSHTYMADYLEEQRQKAIIQKLRELRQLIEPIRL